MITEEHYSNLEIIKPECIFAYVYDKTLGEGKYLGFDPFKGYTYEFNGTIHTALNFKHMTTIIALQSFPFTKEQLEELKLRSTQD